jgi:hypothetical protein
MAILGCKHAITIISSPIIHHAYPLDWVQIFNLNAIFIFKSLKNRRAIIGNSSALRMRPFERALLGQRPGIFSDF